MKITDTAHDVRFLGALVDQGGKISLGGTPGPWERRFEKSACAEIQNKYGVGSPNEASVFGVATTPSVIDAEFIAASRSLVPALVEGAKAILQRWKELQHKKMMELPHVDEKDNRQWNLWNQAWDIRYETHRNAMHDLAKAYKPWMIEAGMEVPV